MWDKSNFSMLLSLPSVFDVKTVKPISKIEHTETNPKTVHIQRLCINFNKTVFTAFTFSPSFSTFDLYLGNGQYSRQLGLRRSVYSRGYTEPPTEPEKLILMFISY